MPEFFVWNKNPTSQMARPNPLDLTVHLTPDVMAFPLTIVPKLRTCIGHMKRFEDRAVLEPLRMTYTGSQFWHIRQRKCHDIWCWMLDAL